jgi:uncharacterized protein (DUF2141 family)
MLAAAALALLPGAAPPGTLDLSVDNLRSGRGTLRICLTRAPQNFPRCIDDAMAVKRNIPAAAPQTQFTGLASGGWAVALIHDENDNRRLDTFAGIPREGVGFSRNPPLGFGAPRFEKAQFAVGTGLAAQQVRMRYFF